MGVVAVGVRSLRTGIVAAACSLGLGAVCLGGLSGCSSALAGDGAALLSARVTSVPASSTEKDALASSADDTHASAAAKASPSADPATSGLVGSSGATDAPWDDGTYYATGRGGKFGGVPVTVVIKGGRITSITLGANSETGAMAEKARSVVVPQIITSQGIDDIDTATGATMTSEAILDGVSQALDRAAK